MTSLREFQIAKTDKVNETKGNKSGEGNEIARANNYSNELDPHFFYQNNFGAEESPFVSQSIKLWIDNLSAEVVLEAMRRAVIDQKKVNLM